LRLSVKDLKALEAQGRVVLPARPSKYRAERVTTEDGSFDSKAEYKRWCTLKLLARAGVIGDLKRQVPFPFEMDGTVIFKWIADFTYTEKGSITVEDVKGVATPLYKLKKKLIQAKHNITIVEIKKP
jgi:hypothetical protein